MTLKPPDSATDTLDTFSGLDTRLDTFGYVVEPATGVAATDLANIQAQITLASAAGGGTVWLCGGTYIVAAFISLRSKVNIRGAGKRATTVKASSGITAGVFVGQAGQTVTDSTISDLTVDANTLGINGVQISTGTRVRIRDCRVINCGVASNGHGVLFQTASSACVVERCEIDTCQNNGVSINASTDCRVEANTITTVGQGSSGSRAGIEPLSASHRTAIVDNRISGTGAGMGIRLGTSGTGSTDCVIRGNVISNTIGSALEPIGITADCVRTRVLGNSCTGGGDNGISMSAADSVVNDNICYTTWYRGISVIGANCTVTGNLCKNCGQQGTGATGGNYAGIWIGGAGTSGIVVTGNRCYDDQGTKTQEYGVQTVNPGTNCVVVGNDLRGNKTGSLVFFGVNNRAAGNLIDDSTSIASAATITLPAEGDFITVTGVTNITAVTASWIHRTVTLVFTGVLTFTDGSNLKLAGNLVTTADDSITLISDGTNWFEVARSVN